MGTWGVGVLQDDTARDIYDDYIGLFNTLVPHAEVVARLEREHASSFTDADEGPLAWLAVAKAQWDCGALSADLLRKAEEIVELGLGLDRWKEGGEQLLARRKKRLADFLEGLRLPNPRPRKPKKPVRRKPPFVPGDCVAIRLSDGDWGGLVVLACEAEEPDPTRETYGTMVVGELSYKSSTPPTLEEFERRDWLRPVRYRPTGTPHIYNVVYAGLRLMKPRLMYVGRVPLGADDPKESRAWANWRSVGREVVEEANRNTATREATLPPLQSGDEAR